ncbi:MAG TPA: hypothetical protein VGV93_08135 [Acidimicrobiales bacterium]|nr:hypothetical protein [Acidimicrobiales bacterium]
MRYQAGGRTHDALLAAGLPTWAPYGPDDQEESVYVWVADDDLHLLLVGDEEVGSEVASFCLDVLGEREPSPVGDAEPDLSTPVALAHIRSDSFGHGSLGRDSLRPLRELLQFVVAELGRS